MAFQEFSGKEYLKIDIANNFGLDKKTWDERIAWFDAHEGNDDLASLVPLADEPALFYAGITAWKKTQKGEPSGYPISLDATCSGIQILSVLAGDREAAKLCNVVDTGKREDAYTSIYQGMVARIGDAAKIDRKRTKQAIMTAFYGSTAVPKNVFGEGELLQTFYEVMLERAPGAWEINETMLAIWDPMALTTEWVLPDNFHVVVKVMGTVTETVHFLNEPFEVSHSQNMPIEAGRSLGANMVHSLDGMVVREMVRRCSYDPVRAIELLRWIGRGLCGKLLETDNDRMVQTLWHHYQDSGFLSARILDHLAPENLGHVKADPILRLIESMPKKPFQVITVHDCFRCLPNYGNDLRRQYNQLLAEIAESGLLSFLISQMLQKRVVVQKLDPSLAGDVRQSNYALS